MRRSFSISSPLLHLAIIAALALLIYSNTISTPFQFDDKLNIVDNPVVKSLDDFWPPSGSRWFGYLTFALNYRMTGLDPWSYHAVNLGIHVLNAFLVYWLVLLIYRTPYFVLPGAEADDRTQRRRSFTALSAALLFAVHPVQTQAVTYIVQRFASLATLLYLLSVTTYMKMRLLAAPAGERAAGRTRTVLTWSLSAASLLCAVLAMKTKETAFTLPAVILLVEFSFFRRPGERLPFKRRLISLLPYILTLAIIPLALLGSGRGLERAFTASSEISRHDYLLTQFRVLVTYLRLLVLPVNQSIDYDFPLSRNFLEMPVLLSFLLLAVVFGLAILLYARSRGTSRPSRLIGFGILWFFITLSVESSIIPIADVIFEHRLYLPSVGAFTAFTVAAASLAETLQQRYRHAERTAVLVGLAALIALASAAYARNAVWSSELSVWEDAVAKHPGAFRSQSMLGILYQARGDRARAINAYRTAISLNPSYAEAHVNLGSIYVELGMLDDGMREFMFALQLRSLDDIDTASLFVNMGYCYLRKGLPDRAIEFYNDAVSVNPNDATVYYYLAKAYEEKGMRDKAAEFRGKAHILNPDKY